MPRKASSPSRSSRASSAARGWRGAWARNAGRRSAGGGSSRRWSKRSSRFTAYPRAGPALDRIKDQHDDGREGESILFDDSWDHEVYNKGGSEWVDLIVDVRRPMPFFSTPSTGSSSPS
ncbi:MAG: aspartyl/asparaginyl beta-hydroxylase domain-containing protein [Planctomycetaceae bacterium]|nr:aspartyl/asparaginyl beta-hydroxylase domain-containing protein [Planctomycetaceae bacterium]